MKATTQAKLLALTDLAGVGDKRALEMAELAGGIEEVYNAPLETVTDLHYIDTETYNALQELDSSIKKYATLIEDATERGITLLTPFEDRYPEALKDQHSPITLFLKGDEELLEAECLSFAGSRDANETALDWTRSLSTALVDEGYCIVSGGAFGVDKAAHEGALDAGGKTIIVSPSGHDNPYPRANAELFDRVAERGLVISHRFPDQQPARGGFLYRNRTNSALSSSIIIAAAGKEGGSMAQYEYAIGQGRSVFIPHENHGVEPYEGLAEMQSNNSVTAVESAEDVLTGTGYSEEQQTLDSW